MRRKALELDASIRHAMGVLREICTHDDFVEEPNGDYHKPGYDYRCRICGFVTSMRPKKPGMD